MGEKYRNGERNSCIRFRYEISKDKPPVTLKFPDRYWFSWGQTRANGESDQDLHGFIVVRIYNIAEIHYSVNWEKLRVGIKNS